MVPIQWRQRRVGVRPCQACSYILLDVSLRGQVERFLQDSAGFVGCCLGLAWRTAPKRQQVGGTPFLRRHAFLRCRRSVAKARPRNSLIGRSVVLALDTRIALYTVPFGTLASDTNV